MAELPRQSSGVPSQPDGYPESWTLEVCDHCHNHHQGRRYGSCVTEFDPAGDTLANTYTVDVVPEERLIAVQDKVEQLHETIRRVLDLTSTTDKELYGRDVFLVGNFQARGMLTDALTRSRPAGG
jgi:hypothetical protein